MNIEAIKLDLVQDILKVKDERILKGVKEFLASLNKVAEPESKLYPMTVEELYQLNTKTRDINHFYFPFYSLIFPSIAKAMYRKIAF